MLGKLDAPTLEKAELKLTPLVETLHVDSPLVHRFVPRGHANYYAYHAEKTPTFTVTVTPESGDPDLVLNLEKSADVSKLPIAVNGGALYGAQFPGR